MQLSGTLFYSSAISISLESLSRSLDETFTIAMLLKKDFGLPQLCFFTVIIAVVSYYFQKEHLKLERQM